MNPELDAGTVAELASIIAAQRALYFTTDAGRLFDAVLPQLRLGLDLLTGPHIDSPTFRALAGTVTQAGLLAARMAFFDLEDERLTRDLFSLVTETVAVAGDEALSAVVRAHHAFVPGFAGEVSDARALLKAARAHAQQAPGPRLWSWLHCVSAEIAARTGDTRASLTHIRQAEQALSGHGEDPEWLDFFDERQWAGFAGQVYLLAGKTAEAATHLQHALSQLSEGHKQRSVFLLDLALAQADRDAENAAHTAHQALDALAVVPYAAARARLPRVMAALRGTPFAAELLDRIRTQLSTTGT